MPANVQWTVVATPQHKEKRAQLNLERQGFAVYCPTVMKRVSHARSIENLPKPLFPGYLFVQIPREPASWRPVLSTAGVRTLILSGGKPVVADKLVAALKAREGTAAGGMQGPGGGVCTILKQFELDRHLGPLKAMLGAAAVE